MIFFGKALFIVYIIVLSGFLKEVQTTTTTTSGLRCWVGSTVKDSPEYPPQVKNCTAGLDTCQKTGGTDGVIRMICASSFRCQQTQKISAIDVLCCQTNECNSVSASSPTPSPSGSSKPVFWPTVVGLFATIIAIM